VAHSASPSVTSAPVPTAGALRFAGFDLRRPLVMGIVNVTPDSFYDGGYHPDPESAIAHGRRLMEEGADILDIGGESTRPGAAAPDTDAEIARVVPVIEALSKAGAVISVDTRRAAVMRATIAAGARIVNDITALTGDADSVSVVAETGASTVLMHMQGEPATMQKDPQYKDAPAEIEAYLAERVAVCGAAGIPLDRIAVDPGIGFGKRPQHNLQLIAQLDRFHRLGVAVLIGVSRKSFIGMLSRGEKASDRLPGSLAGALAAVERGAQIIRVHDVAATVQALTIWRAIAEQSA
jgi:dihydropteroate synthase